MFAKVIVDISNNEVDKVFDYGVGNLPVLLGHRVIVPFGKREIEGYVISLSDTSDYDTNKIKSIISIVDPYPVIGADLLRLMERMVELYHLRIIDVLRLFIPSELRAGKVKELISYYIDIAEEFRGKDPSGFIRSSATAQREVIAYLADHGRTNLSELNKICSAAAVRNLIMRGIISKQSTSVNRTPYDNDRMTDKTISLTQEQSEVVQNIVNASGGTFLLHGVTGSGKTEVYMHCISNALRQGKSAIMLVPEISLTPQVLRTFRARFGDSVALLHSGLSAGERFDEWRRLLGGEAKVAIGARSAIFAPVSNLGMVIIDEEHDSSYTSDSNPRYETHRVAKMRCEIDGCTLVLGSATPSIESYYRAKSGEYKLVQLKQRVNARPLPDIQVVDMKNEVYSGNNGIFSRELETRLHECIDRGEQAMIFINRRGYSSFVMCRECGYVAKCEQCDVSLVYHKENGRELLKCHYCGNRYSLPTACPNCNANNMRRGYVGTEQVEEQLSKMFPATKVVRMDNDTTQAKDSHFKILEEFASGRAKILVGTQMIAKGHDFPNVTLVGIIDADMSLHFSDYRSCERTYQLITQVAGRAGRDSKTGKVVLQTYSPNHYVYRYAVSNNYHGFYSKESNLREVTKFPPYADIVRILVSSEDKESVADTLKGIYDEVKVLADTNKTNFAFLNYMWAPVKQIKLMYRAQILARISNDINTILQQIYKITDKYRTRGVIIFVETNPNNLS